MIDMTSRVPQMLEGTVLVSSGIGTGVAALGTALGTALSDADWSKIKGAEGALFLAVIACIVLWTNSIFKERRRQKLDDAREARLTEQREEEDRRREERHQETLQMQKENAERIMEINTRLIEAKERATVKYAENTQAIMIMDRHIVELSNKVSDFCAEVQSRPCQLKKQS